MARGGSPRLLWWRLFKQGLFPSLKPPRTRTRVLGFSVLPSDKRSVPVGRGERDAPAEPGLFSLCREPGVCHPDPPGIWTLCRLLNDITRVWTPGPVGRKF